MTRYLVTGATGFVGGHLTRAILARGDAVTALARPSPRAGRLRELGVDVVEGDLVNGRGLDEALRGADRVIHLAAVVRARAEAEFWAVNRDGTERLVHAMAALPEPPRLVVCSSLAAAGPARGRGPVSVYGASKLAAERVVRDHAHRVPAVILRPGIVHGPGEPGLLPALLPMVRLGLVFKPGFGPRRYSVIYVGDLCTALLAAAERGTTVPPADPTVPPGDPTVPPGDPTGWPGDSPARDGDPTAGVGDPGRHQGPGAGVHVISDGLDHHWRDICAALARADGRRAPAVLPVPLPLLAAVAALAELAGRLRGTAPAFNRDKVRELRHPDWTCTHGGPVQELGFTPATSLLDGLRAALVQR